MFKLMLLIFIPMILISILILINFLLSKKSTMDREKPSPFECGFNPITSARLPFTIQFFIIMIIFLIFDIEIIILIPLIPTLQLNLNLSTWFLTFLIILIILFLGLIWEWNEQSTTWIK
uniref:NADH-ubiquinone oxidoreductase chain 3 n=2 Tax=Anterhynchium TaxID=329989 RepID=A0A6M9AX26_9HYME|nr:NADH dehydrogenase subunit 3 [Anterhynchium aff. flavomarginatum HB]QKK69278.1 NADH dehydrogenase subunit 3 [Anterhynchium aff. flavomarginatum SC]